MASALATGSPASSRRTPTGSRSTTSRASRPAARPGQWSTRPPTPLGDRLYPEGRSTGGSRPSTLEENGLTWSSTADCSRRARTGAAVPANGVAVPARPRSVVPEAFAASLRRRGLQEQRRALLAGQPGRERHGQDAGVRLTEPIPASPVPYVWRVRRNDSKGNPGPWSARPFVSLGRLPARLARERRVAAGLRRTTSNWSDVPGATSYTGSRLRNGSALVTVTTTSHRLATAKLSPTGNYTWTVTALDAGGKVSAPAPPALPGGRHRTDA